MLVLSPLDYFIVFAFAIAIIAIRSYAKHQVQSAFEFLSAGRTLTLPAFVATLVSTWYGGILGIAESAKYYGFGTWLLLGVPYYLFGIIYALFIAKRVRSEDQISIPERFRSRFGEQAGRAAAFLIWMLAIPAAHVLMLGVIGQLLTGLSLKVVMVLVAAVVSLFLFRSGFLADVRLGLVAFCLMFLGFLVAFCSLLLRQPFAEMYSAVPAPMRSVSGGTDLPTILSFLILGAWTLVDPGFHQRVASAKTPEIARKGVLASVICWILFDFLSISCALYAMRLDVAKPLEIFPRFAQEALPDGTRGLFMIGMIGTILSACCGYALVAGGTLGRDLLSRLNPESQSSDDAKWVRWGIVASCFGAIPVAMISGESVINLWYGWSGAVVGALLIPFLVSYRSTKTLPGVTLASLCGFGVSVVWMIYAIQHGNPTMTISLGTMSFGLGTLLPSLLICASILAICRLSCKVKP